MTDYWKSFWLSQAKDSINTDPQLQVLRTLNKQPVSPQAFADIVDSIVAMLKPEVGNNLLDLCCGNGVITQELCNRFIAVTAVDLSKEFVAQISNGSAGMITAIAADARNIEFPENSFDRILLYAGLQYFSESETIKLFICLKRWIRRGGLVVIGDIPDATRKWNFFNSQERESDYFEALKAGNPIVGNWFEPSWLEKLSHYAGFMSVVTHCQPTSFPYQHYRFDLVLAS